MRLDSATVSRLVKEKDTKRLRKVSVMLREAEHHTSLACEAAKRIRFPAKTRLCDTVREIKKLRARVSRSLGKKKNKISR